jgi:hypothetical protein
MDDIFFCTGERDCREDDIGAVGLHRSRQARATAHCNYTPSTLSQRVTARGKCSWGCKAYGAHASRWHKVQSACKRARALQCDVEVHPVQPLG